MARPTPDGFGPRRSGGVGKALPTAERGYTRSATSESRNLVHSTRSRVVVGVIRSPADVLPLKHRARICRDLLFRTRLDARDTYIYLLVEHQSRPDRFTPLRMTEYLVAIWNRYLHQNPDTTTLPAIVPIVIHSGHWNTPTELFDLIDLDTDTRATLSDHLPHLRLILDDLTTVDLPTLRARPLTPATRAMLALHKITAGNRNLGTDLLPLVPDIRALADAPGGSDDLICVMTYILLWARPAKTTWAR